MISTIKFARKLKTIDEGLKGHDTLNRLVVVFVDRSEIKKIIQ